MFNVSQKLTSILTDIANAIRTKTGLSEPIKADDFPDILKEYYADELEQKINGTLTTIDNNFVTSIRSYAFCFCSSLTLINFPSCTTIKDGAFQGCSSLTSVNFPVCLSIGIFAFVSCRSLTSLNFPFCTTINHGAFYDCRSLTSISLPACTYITSYAFQYCFNLISLYLTNSSVCSLRYSNAFSSTPIGGYSTSAKRYGSIFVPKSLLTSYKSATNWTYFSNRIFAIEDYPIN